MGRLLVAESKAKSENWEVGVGVQVRVAQMAKGISSSEGMGMMGFKISDAPVLRSHQVKLLVQSKEGRRSTLEPSRFNTCQKMGSWRVAILAVASGLLVVFSKSKVLCSSDRKRILA